MRGDIHHLFHKNFINVFFYILRTEICIQFHFLDGRTISIFWTKMCLPTYSLSKILLFYTVIYFSSKRNVFTLLIKTSRIFSSFKHFQTEFCLCPIAFSIFYSISLYFKLFLRRWTKAFRKLKSLFLFLWFMVSHYWYLPYEYFFRREYFLQNYFCLKMLYYKIGNKEIWKLAFLKHITVTLLLHLATKI